MKKLHLLLLAGGLSFYISANSEPKTKGKSALTSKKINNSVERSNYSEEKKTITKVATSFYKWYIKTTKSDYDTTNAFSFIIVKGENGKCKVDFEPYFNQLRQLKTISKKFMNKEIERNKTCIEHMKSINWDEYKISEPYQYEDFCPDCSYMYWFQSQETYDGVEITDMNKKGDIWFITLQFYSDYQNKRTRYESPQPTVKIEKENGKWLITEITFVRNK